MSWPLKVCIASSHTTEKKEKKHADNSIKSGYHLKILQNPKVSKYNLLRQIVTKVLCMLHHKKNEICILSRLTTAKEKAMAYFKSSKII